MAVAYFLLGLDAYCPGNFFLLGGFCQESKESIKELKNGFHSAV